VLASIVKKKIMTGSSKKSKYFCQSFLSRLFLSLDRHTTIRIVIIILEMEHEIQFEEQLPKEMQFLIFSLIDLVDQPGNIMAQCIAITNSDYINKWIAK
jgi:hypothetical protein